VIQKEVTALAFRQIGPYMSSIVLVAGSQAAGPTVAVITLGIIGPRLRAFTRRIGRALDLQRGLGILAEMRALFAALLDAAMDETKVATDKGLETTPRLRALQKHLNTVKLLIVDELGYVQFTVVDSELLFEVFSKRYERGSTIVTSNLAIR
jgi:hypothetical protein